VSAVERLRTRRWNRVEYGRLIEHRFLDEDDPIELVDGLLLVKEPQYTPHATAVMLVTEALRTAFGPGWCVRPQLPLALDDRSEPEPDVCVVPGSPRDYLGDHPTGAALVVEVAASGLAIARGRKATMYARSGIADYWILNLVHRVLEVHREPVHLRGTRRGWRYRRVHSVGADDTVIPLALPAARIAIADLLP
jgi:Uma2 family endonuclease